MHQGATAFSIQSRGKQCTAMAAASIVMSALKNPRTWTKCDIDDILNYGDKLYYESIRSRPISAEKHAYLFAEEVNKIIQIKERKFEIEFGQNMYGRMEEDMEYMPNIENFLRRCQNERLSGILTFNQLSFGIITTDNLIGVFDSHSRDTDGKATNNGFACFFSGSVNKLREILISHFPKSARVLHEDQYQFTQILITKTLGDYKTEVNVMKENKIDNVVTHNYDANIMIKITNDVVNEENYIPKNPDHDQNKLVYEFNKDENDKDYNSNLKSQECIDRDESKEYPHVEEVEDDRQQGKREKIYLHSKEKEEQVCNVDNVSAEFHETCVSNAEIVDEVLNQNLIDNDENVDEELENERLSTGDNAIVNMRWIWAQLQEVYKNHDKTMSCKFEDLDFIKNRVHGLITYSNFICNTCSKTEVICNVPDEEKDLDLNVASVIGCHTIGIGLSQLQELLSILDMNPISYSKWQRHETETILKIKEAAKKTMMDAAKEEGRLARERGDVVDGIPFITVEADGSYMKRSYINGRYDSPSCCVIIIGRQTNKIIQIIVKQKTCATCDYGYNNAMPIKEHVCHRNHGRDQSSTSMESSAMAEAFDVSIKE